MAAAAADLAKFLGSEPEADNVTLEADAGAAT
jgi:hypothetical protein